MFMHGFLAYFTWAALIAVLLFAIISAALAIWWV